MKIEQSEERYIIKRDYRKINFEEVAKNIFEDNEYIKAFEEKEPDQITEMVIELINKYLDKFSKFRKIKIRKPNEKPKSRKIEELINRKEITYKKWKKENKIEDYTELKNLKLIIQKEIKELEKETLKKEFENCEDNSRKLWQTARNQVWGDNHKVMDKILENNTIKRGSRNVANVFNRYYVTKVRKIKEKMIGAKADPMINFKKYVKNIPFFATKF